VFHNECVAGATFTDPEGRFFDTVANQLTRTGSAGRRIVLKMDIEGAEWDSLLNTPDEVLRRIDQIAIEMHGVEEEKYLLARRSMPTLRSSPSRPAVIRGPNPAFGSPSVSTGGERMGMARSMGMGVMGGATTMLARRAARGVLHDRIGRPRLPRRTQRRRGFGPMLAWAAAAGLILALADVVQEQRKYTSGEA
jgi:hypothetical protein